MPETDGDGTFRRISDESLCAIIIHDKGMVMYANHEASRLLIDGPREDLIGRDLMDFVPEDKRSELFERMKRISRSKEKTNISNYNLIDHNGEPLPTESVTFAVRYQGKPMNAIISKGLHEMREKNVKLQRLNDVLKLMMKTMRHDVRNRLTFAYGICDMILKGRDIKKEDIELAHEYIKRAIDLTERMNELESAVVEDLPKNEVLLSDLILPVAEESDIDVDLSGDAKIEADKTLESVFENLIMNSIQHGKADNIIIKIESEDDKVRIRLEDNGSGIPDELTDDLFEEGERRNRPGTIHII
jgi:PAS domain S-box-containing protein